jgi:hypothetical protein
MKTPKKVYAPQLFDSPARGRRTCPCGAIISNSTKTCPKCGAIQEKKPPTPEEVIDCCLDIQALEDKWGKDTLHYAFRIYPKMVGFRKTKN